VREIYWNRWNQSFRLTFESFSVYLIIIIQSRSLTWLDERVKSIHLHSLWHKIGKSSGNKLKMNSINENRYFSINYKKKNKKKKNEKMKRQAIHPSNHENVIIINRNSSVDHRFYLKSRYTNLAWQSTIEWIKVTD